LCIKNVREVLTGERILPLYERGRRRKNKIENNSSVRNMTSDNKKKKTEKDNEMPYVELLKKNPSCRSIRTILKKKSSLISKGHKVSKDFRIVEGILWTNRRLRKV